MKPASAATVWKRCPMLRRARGSGGSFSLVVTDCHMPDMDGFDFASRIRNSPHLTNAVVMMLTSGEQRGDVERCREIGHLCDLRNRFVGRSYGRRSPPRSSAGPSTWKQEQNAAMIIAGESAPASRRI